MNELQLYILKKDQNVSKKMNYIELEGVQFGAKGKFVKDLPTINISTRYDTICQTIQ